MSEAFALGDSGAWRLWTEVIALRRRGLWPGLVLTTVAASGGWVRLGMMAFNRLLYWRWIERRAPLAQAGDDVVEHSGLRVLAAENKRVNQIVLETLPAQAGITPVIKADGAQAVQAWAEAE